MSNLNIIILKARNIGYRDCLATIHRSLFWDSATHWSNGPLPWWLKPNERAPITDPARLLEAKTR